MPIFAGFGRIYGVKNVNFLEIFSKPHRSFSWMRFDEMSVFADLFLDFWRKKFTFF